MTILTLLLSIALVGFIVWLIVQIPMPQQFRTIIIAVCCVALVLYLLQSFGVVTGLPHMRLW